MEGINRNIYLVITAADIAFRRADVRALRQCRKDAINIARDSFGNYYLRALDVKRNIDGMILDLGY